MKFCYIMLCLVLVITSTVYAKDVKSEKPRFTVGDFVVYRSVLEKTATILLPDNVGVELYSDTFTLECISVETSKDENKHITVYAVVRFSQDSWADDGQSFFATTDILLKYFPKEKIVEKETSQTIFYEIDESGNCIELEKEKDYIGTLAYFLLYDRNVLEQSWKKGESFDKPYWSKENSVEIENNGKIVKCDIYNLYLKGYNTYWFFYGPDTPITRMLRYRYGQGQSYRDIKDSSKAGTLIFDMEYALAITGNK
ncbi:hypothetical protein KAJ27_21630 [bacterium]|nr:hypothetical protein [bacterium]